MTEAKNKKITTTRVLLYDDENFDDVRGLPQKCGGQIHFCTSDKLVRHLPIPKPIIRCVRACVYTSTEPITCVIGPFRAVSVLILLPVGLCVDD